MLGNGSYVARMRCVVSDLLAYVLDALGERRIGLNAWTPVMHAIHKNQAASVQALLSRGADVNAKTRRRFTPLMMAAGNENLEIVQMLLAHGADPYAETDEGITALTTAVSGGAFSDIDRPLLGGCPAPGLKLKDNFGGKYAWFFARFKGCSEILSLISQRNSPKAARNQLRPQTSDFRLQVRLVQLASGLRSDP